jgi:hypothetical protein
MWPVLAGIVPLAVRGWHAHIGVLLAGACVALASGCGGSSRQNADEPEKTYTVSIPHASFPAKQSIVRPETMSVAVHNTSDATIPNVAMTVDSFSYTSDYPGLANDKKPVWVIETGPGAVSKIPVESESVSPPGGGQTAYTNTWALGALAAGDTRTFRWHVMPVKAGTYTVHYTVAAGLGGRAKARLADGSIPHGQFTVTITQPPPATHVNPNTGQVEPGSYASTL